MKPNNCLESEFLFFLSVVDSFLRIISSNAFEARIIWRSSRIKESLFSVYNLSTRFRYSPSSQSCIYWIWNSSKYRLKYSPASIIPITYESKTTVHTVHTHETTSIQTDNNEKKFTVFIKALKNMAKPVAMIPLVFSLLCVCLSFFFFSFHLSSVVFAFAFI